MCIDFVRVGQLVSRGARVQLCVLDRLSPTLVVCVAYQPCVVIRLIQAVVVPSSAICWLLAAGLVQLCE